MCSESWPTVAPAVISHGAAVTQLYEIQSGLHLLSRRRVYGLIDETN